MKILVTGGAGFIGSNITDALCGLGHDVVVADNLSSGKKANVNHKAKFYELDITDKKAVGEMFMKEKFDIVDHHAAQIDVRKSVADPINDANINVIGALNLFENARINGVKKLIFASSGGTIYGECPNEPPDESAEARPLSPYGITKYAVEFYMKFYQDIHKMNYTVLRYGNVYGPRQDPHGEAGVVAIFSEKMLRREDLNIFGDGKQNRDYVYVGDVVRANVKALDRADKEIVNIGTKAATSVNRLFELMAEITQYGKKPVYQPARAGELFNSVLDNKKAAEVLQWKPEVSIKDGLAKTIEYFRNKS